MLRFLPVVIKLALAESCPKDTGPLAELGLGLAELRELLWAVSWVNMAKGGGICLDTGNPGPNRLVVDPNPTAGFGFLVG